LQKIYFARQRRGGVENRRRGPVRETARFRISPLDVTRLTFMGSGSVE
jgi:hypothetical protein